MRGARRIRIGARLHRSQHEIIASAFVEAAEEIQDPSMHAPCEIAAKRAEKIMVRTSA